MKTVNERLLNDLVANRILWIRYGNTIANRMVNALNDLDKLLFTEIVDVVESSPYGADSFTAKRLGSLLHSVRELNKRATDSAFLSLTNDLRGASDYTAGYYPSLFDSVLSDIVKKHYPIHRVSEEQLYSAVMSKPFQGRLLSEWADNIESDRMKKIENAIRTGYLTGETSVQIARRVTGTKKNNYKDGIINVSRANATAIAKTALNHLQTVALDSFTKANKDIINGYMWVSTLDNKTTTICILRDGLFYTTDWKPINHDLPALGGAGRAHFCCRSFPMPVTVSIDKLGKINRSDVTPELRASMNGQVSGGLTYLEWIKSQSYSTLVDVFGVTRARLVVDAGFNVSQFYDKGELIPLEELKEAHANMFARAKILTND
ncbi:TPA: hypothetical protein JRS25_004139 [Escherichia coli]|nr:hypothetical protein [Escherichia coli]